MVNNSRLLWSMLSWKELLCRCNVRIQWSNQLMMLVVDCWGSFSYDLKPIRESSMEDFKKLFFGGFGGECYCTFKSSGSNLKQPNNEQSIDYYVNYCLYYILFFFLSLNFAYLFVRTWIGIVRGFSTFGRCWKGERIVMLLLEC